MGSPRRRGCRNTPQCSILERDTLLLNRIVYDVRMSSKIRDRSSMAADPLSPPVQGPAPAGRAVAPASQTLSRGIRILELLGDAGEPLTIDEVARRLGVHRSVGYRLLRTLEDHG